ncbi:hypothetical protein KKG22_02905 [Patescibacteria group bacterium]|nr:hypothetical protein [Patescibacteria group bacterium]MBU1721469.1 hypothetical protein [Patescibacteria group bacterium]MBU1900774.1 hypothetical protein [Patescibacteria group bacterium]
MSSNGVSDVILLPIVSDSLAIQSLFGEYAQSLLLREKFPRVKFPLLANFPSRDVLRRVQHSLLGVLIDPMFSQMEISEFTELFHEVYKPPIIGVVQLAHNQHAFVRNDFARKLVRELEYRFWANGSANPDTIIYAAIVRLLTIHEVNGNLPLVEKLAPPEYRIRRAL